MTFSYNTHNSHFIGHPYISQQEKERALKFRRTISKVLQQYYIIHVLYMIHTQEKIILLRKEISEREKEESASRDIKI